MKIIVPIYLALCGLLFAGWVMNIYALMHMISVLSGMGILRIVGIFLAPLGGVLGWF